MPLVSVTTPGPRTKWNARKSTSSTAKSSSTKTPALLIRAISFTPNALTSVVNTIRQVASSTPLAASLEPEPSPTNWKNDVICGSVRW